MAIRAFLPLGVLLLLQIGCVTTKIDSVKPGLLNDNPTLMLEKFKEVQGGQTLAQVKGLGFTFDHPDARNIDKKQGHNAIKALFGSDALERMLDGSLLSSDKPDQKVDAALKSLNPYTLFIVPYHIIKTKTDRFYISRKDTFRTGQVLNMYFLFKEETLVYHTSDDKRIDEKESEKAFLKGLFDLLTGAKEVSDEYKDYRDKD